MSDELIQFGYLVAAVLFILGIRGLARPRTAVRGNQLGSLGMLVAVVVTLTDNDIIGYGAIVGGLVVGTAIGVLLATRVQMTGMPQLVALFNGFGGAASLLVAAAGFIEVLDVVKPDLETSVATAAALAFASSSASMLRTISARSASKAWSCALSRTASPACSAAKGGGECARFPQEVELADAAAAHARCGVQRRDHAHP